MFAYCTSHHYFATSVLLFHFICIQTAIACYFKPFQLWNGCFTCVCCCLRCFDYLLLLVVLSCVLLLFANVSHVLCLWTLFCCCLRFVDTCLRFSRVLLLFAIASHVLCWWTLCCCCLRVCLHTFWSLFVFEPCFDLF